LTLSCHTMSWSGSTIVSWLELDNGMIHWGKARGQTLIVLNCLISPVINRFHRVVLRYLRGYRLGLGWNIIAVHILGSSMSLKIIRPSYNILLCIPYRSTSLLLSCCIHSSSRWPHSLHCSLLHLHALSLLQSPSNRSFSFFEYLLCQIILCNYVSLGERSSPLDHCSRAFHRLWTWRSHTWGQYSRICT
jgi:hypothetical protein